jgi:tripartite-type tricarboxylate transporter receptor subunit TctC
MKLPRRRFLHFAAGAAALPALSQTARAQAYPNRPVRIIVGFPAGGSADLAARLVAQWLSERLAQQFMIENRPGAGGNIAVEAAVNAPSDGYALLLIGPPQAINATLYEKLNFNFLRDIAPIASILRYPNVMEVHPAVPVKTVPEFIAYAKANPGRLNFASAGNGTSQHVSGELFKTMTGVNMVHVPYRGNAPALTDLVGGQVQVMFDNIPTSIEHIRAGKLRPLAVTTTARSGVLPDLPTVAEFVPGYEASGWFGIGAPRNTSAEVINALNNEINAGLADAKFRARLANLGSTALVFSPAEFGKHLADETEKWGKVIRAANIKAE